ncbi:hypothetical protein B0H19DRAFT_862111, partial [Mycena capillaripes]
DELARYDAEIARLQAQLRGTENEHLALQSYYDECRCVLSPVRRLPPEILADIFALCDAATPPEFKRVRDCISSSRQAAMSVLAHRPLLIISQVCARWHDIVMGTPTLW